MRVKDIYGMYDLLVNHNQCGKRSGIPWHCRLFFIFVWRFVSVNGTFYDSYMEAMRKKHFKHVPCPLCLILGNTKKIKSCTEKDRLCKDCMNNRFK